MARGDFDGPRNCWQAGESSTRLGAAPPQDLHWDYGHARLVEVLRTEADPSTRLDAVEMFTAYLSAGWWVRAAELSFGATSMHTGDSPRRRGGATTTGDPAGARAVRLAANWEAMPDAEIMAAVAAKQRVRSTTNSTLPAPWRFEGRPPTTRKNKDDCRSRPR